MNLNNPRLNYILMTSLVFFCAFEYIFTKPILEFAPTITVIWLKYIVGFVTVVCVKIIRGGRMPFFIRDIPVFFVLGLFGEALYYIGGLYALSYIPIALLTVIIAMSPVLSVVFDRFIYKRKVRFQTIIGVGVSLFGICLVAGVDTGMLASGRIYGYLLATVPVICANLYNVIAIKITKKYDTFDIAIYIIGATVILCTPYGLSHLPPPEALNATFIMTIVFLGSGVAAFGVFAYVNSLKILGATTSLMFSNFVPVVSVIFSWLLLSETVLPLQLVGGAIALIGCAAVIWYKGKTEIFNKPAENHTLT